MISVLQMSFGLIDLRPEGVKISKKLEEEVAESNARLIRHFGLRGVSACW
jgi:hypothetical protein